MSGHRARSRLKHLLRYTGSLIAHQHHIVRVHPLQGFGLLGTRCSGRDERLLVCALIEARSCERFRILSEEIADPDLAEFYRSLMESEARHYTTFLGFGRKYGEGIDVDGRWKHFLEFEAGLMDKYGKSERMHG